MDMDKELNCSEGARMLIERMQSHPKDFKYDGRFSRIVDQILGKVPVGFSELSDRDTSALTVAFQQYIMEPQLTEYVVDEIFNGEKRRAEEQAKLGSAYSQKLGQSMMSTKNQIASNMLSGYNDPRTLWQAGVHNPAQGQVLWTEETGLQEKKSPSIFDEMRRKLKRNKSK